MVALANTKDVLEKYEKPIIYSVADLNKTFPFGKFLNEVFTGKPFEKYPEIDAEIKKTLEFNSSIPRKLSLKTHNFLDRAGRAENLDDLKKISMAFFIDNDANIQETLIRISLERLRRLVFDPKFVFGRDDFEHDLERFKQKFSGSSVSFEEYLERISPKLSAESSKAARDGAKAMQKQFLESVVRQIGDDDRINKVIKALEAFSIGINPENLYARMKVLRDNFNEEKLTS